MGKVELLRAFLSLEGPPTLLGFPRIATFWKNASGGFPPKFFTPSLMVFNQEAVFSLGEGGKAKHPLF